MSITGKVKHGSITNQVTEPDDDTVVSLFTFGGITLTTLWSTLKGWLNNALDFLKTGSYTGTAQDLKNDIDTNTGNISTNTTNISTNTSDISTLQTSKLSISDLDDTPDDDADTAVSSQFIYGAVTGQRSGWRQAWVGTSTDTITSSSATWARYLSGTITVDAGTWDIEWFINFTINGATNVTRLDVKLDYSGSPGSVSDRTFYTIWVGSSGGSHSRMIGKRARLVVPSTRTYYIDVYCVFTGTANVQANGATGRSIITAQRVL